MIALETSTKRWREDANQEYNPIEPILSDGSEPELVIDLELASTVNQKKSRIEKILSQTQRKKKKKKKVGASGTVL